MVLGAVVHFRLQATVHRIDDVIEHAALPPPELARVCNDAIRNVQETLRKRSLLCYERKLPWPVMINGFEFCGKRERALIKTCRSALSGWDYP